MYQYSVGERVIGIHSGRLGTVTAIFPAGPEILFDSTPGGQVTEPQIMHGGHVMPAEKQEIMTSTKTSDLRAKIAKAINSVSAENGSNTPDFILAEYLTDCLAAFDRATKAREKWYGKVDEVCEPPIDWVKAELDANKIRHELGLDKF